MSTELESVSAEESNTESVEVQGSAFPEVELHALVEALLLASPEPLSLDRLQEVCRCNEEDLKEALATIKEAVESDDRGIEVVAVGGRYQLRTKPLFAPYIRELISARPRRLSPAALETLAIVAYQQPIVKSEIEKIRGVDVSPTLKTLLEREIIKVLGYQQSAGTPALYGTGEQFLKVFGLNSLSELPALRDFKALAKEPGEGVAEDDANEEQAESVAEVENDQPTSDA